ncbi:HigA family addiction module antitoxin [Qipengyuania sp. DSG2-2]|uniref:HigA family addiction module antitoxin n=1 Tax=Qipengyuania sp. DGS2-2 TaxID=3349631 RepID=UPI0036D2B9AE
MGIELHPSLRSHPGTWLMAEVVEPHDLTVTQCAAHLGVSRQNMSALLNGRAALSPMMALRFEKAFGIKADTLMGMQVAYDLAQLKLKGEEPDVKRLELAES